MTENIKNHKLEDYQNGVNKDPDKFLSKIDDFTLLKLTLYCNERHLNDSSRESKNLKFISNVVEELKMMPDASMSFDKSTVVRPVVEMTVNDFC